MAMGYEGLARLSVDGTNEDMALATGGAVPRVRPRLESSSGYGGQIKTPVDEIGIGTPETYDWTVYDGSIDLELTEDFYDRQIETWIFDRQKGAVVNLKSRNGNVQTFNKCYWNNISIAASDGAAVTASLSFVAMQRDSYTIGGDYIGNKRGSDVFCDPPAYNVSLVPIPYWNTVVSIDGVSYEFVTWTVDLSQEVVKFFSCENNPNPVEPRFVAVGPMTAKFSGDYMFLGTAALDPIPSYLTSLHVTLGKTGTPKILKFEDLELETDTDALQSLDSLTPIALEYAAYTLVS